MEIYLIIGLFIDVHKVVAIDVKSIIISCCIRIIAQGNFQLCGGASFIITTDMFRFSSLIYILCYLIFFYYSLCVYYIFDSF